MVLWVDKYRPNKLGKLELHKSISGRLEKMVQSGDFPHLLFYGPSGAGKKTRVMATLGALYGPQALKTKVTNKSFKIKSRTIEISTLSSSYHIELNPSDAGLHDRFVVSEVIKEIAQTQAVNQGAKDKPFKVVVLNDVDRLTKAAQHALRRTMEKYMSTCRIIMCCESTCHVIGPLRSRCLALRIAAPTHDEIVNILSQIAKKEKVGETPKLLKEIAVASDRNLRRAILILEACVAESNPLKEGQTIRLADWQRFVDDLGRAIIEEQSPNRLLQARGKIYELLCNCIPADVILKTLTQVLLKRLDDQVKHQVVRWAAHYEANLKKGSKPIFHLEAFVAKFMSIYKKWIVTTFG